jgi:hypothetical protein
MSADRVRKLAALAGSDNEFEANQAAHQACRLIREGKVVLSDPGDDRSPEHFASDAWAQVQSWFSSAWQPVRPPPSSPQPPPKRPRPRGPFARSPRGDGASCFACGEEIPPGEAFACADGFVHGDCVPAGER